MCQRACVVGGQPLNAPALPRPWTAVLSPHLLVLTSHHSATGSPMPGRQMVAFQMQAANTQAVHSGHSCTTQSFPHPPTARRCSSTLNPQRRRGDGHAHQRHPGCLCTHRIADDHCRRATGTGPGRHSHGRHSARAAGPRWLHPHLHAGTSGAGAGRRHGPALPVLFCASVPSTTPSPRQCSVRPRRTLRWGSTPSLPGGTS
mmetsp:Transcript_39162/g.98711  ORF Transcript_39162/g.98711 Transcript_39162/m.98711 type:complete len:202 (-) Transcript_39162:316-921(-)